MTATTFKSGGLSRHGTACWCSFCREVDRAAAAPKPVLPEVTTAIPVLRDVDPTDSTVALLEAARRHDAQVTVSLRPSAETFGEVEHAVLGWASLRAGSRCDVGEGAIGVRVGSLLVMIYVPVSVWTERNPMEAP